MIVSPAKLAANQANAQKSHGPVTEAGKATCRENAVKHGLSGAGVVLPARMRAKLDEIIADWLRDFPPHSVYEASLVRTMGLALVRMEEADIRLLEFEAVRRQELANSWDDIRADAAAALGEKLGKKPERTVFQLRQTSHGCRWLKQRWEWLKEGLTLTPTCDWSDAEIDQFFDLLGIALEARERSRQVWVFQSWIHRAKEGNTEAVNKLRAQIDLEIDRLDKQANKMSQTTDALLQNLIAGGVWFESNAEGRSVRRLMHDAERLFERTWAKIKEIRKVFMLAADLGFEPQRDEAEVPPPHLLVIAAKTPPSPPPAGDPALPPDQMGVVELARFIGIPGAPPHRSIRERALWELDVMQQAVALELVGPDHLEPFETFAAAVAQGDL